MAMSPYSKATNGRKTRTARDGTVTEFAAIRGYEVLSDVITRVGDRKRPNPHAYTKRRWTTLTGSETEVFGDGTTIVIAGNDLRSSNFTILEPVSFNNNVAAMALSDLYTQVNASSLDVSEDLVQWRQVSKMLAIRRRVLSGIANHIQYVLPTAVKTQRALDTLGRNATRRRIREIDRSLDWLAQRRLEYVYGVAPLIGTVNELARLAVTPPPGQGLMRFVGRGYLRSETTRVILINGIPCIHKMIHKERAKYVCYFSPLNDVTERLAQVSSLNPAAVLYAATPYSMVLDWFIDIGGWFRDYQTSMTHRNNFTGGYVNKSYRWDDDVEWRGQNSAGTYKVSARQSVSRVRFERSPLTSAPIPSRPVLKIPDSLGKLANALSLAKVALPRLDKLLLRRK